MEKREIGNFQTVHSRWSRARVLTIAQETPDEQQQTLLKRGVPQDLWTVDAIPATAIDSHPRTRRVIQSLKQAHLIHLYRCAIHSNYILSHHFLTNNLQLLIAMLLQLLLSMKELNWR